MPWTGKNFFFPQLSNTFIRDRDGRLSNSELESMVIALHCFFTRCQNFDWSSKAESMGSFVSLKL